MSNGWQRGGKRRPAQAGVTGEPAFTGSGLVVLLFGPNSPTTHGFDNRGLVNLYVFPFKDGRADQRCQPGNIEDVAKWEIIGMSVDQDVGRGEFWNDRYAVRDERKIDEIALILDFIVSASEFGWAGGTHKCHKVVRCGNIQRTEWSTKDKGSEEKTMGLTPSSGRPGGKVLFIG